VVVTAAALDGLPHIKVVFALPLQDGDEIGRQLLQTTEQIGLSLRGRLLHGEDLNEIVVEFQVIPVAFQRGVPGLVVDLVIGMQLCELRFVGRVVEKTANELLESRAFVEPLQTDCVP